MEKVNVSYTKLREGARESGLTKLPVHKPVELMKTKDDQVNVFFLSGKYTFSAGWQLCTSCLQLLGSMAIIFARGLQMEQEAIKKVKGAEKDQD